MSTLSDTRSGRRQYLVTYSQVDPDKFPTRESFAAILEEEFNAGESAVKVKHWACCREPHENGGFHYHCAIKLTGTKKWVSVKHRVMSKYGVVINFSDSHDHYISAYNYVCKQDKDVAHHHQHPNLTDVALPKTYRAIAANRAGGKKRKSAKLGKECELVPKKKRLTNSEVANFIRQEQIKSYTEMLAIAELRRDDGQEDLAEYIFLRSEKHLKELLNKTWLMKNAPAKIASRQTSRIEKVREALRSDCVSNCDKAWYECATEVLRLNSIDVNFYARSIRDSLVHGRGKFRNVLLVGPANCGKTFMFKPLKCIFKESELFENPSNDKYGWVGAEKASVFILQDYRWSKECIAWKDLLLLLEGETVKLPAPKNFYAEDVIINSDVAIFATAKESIRYKGPYKTTDPGEDAMMSVRWNIIKFHHEFSEKEQKVVKPCARCFAELALMGAD